MTVDAARPRRVGVIGLGTMGSRIAGHLASRGLEVAGYDIRSIRPPAGVRLATAIADLAASSSICLLSVPDAAATLGTVRELTGAPDRITDTVIDLSTIGMAGAQQASAELSAAGIGYVDCPVSGSLSAAASGQLALMVGAPSPLFDSVTWLLDLIGGSVIHVGPRAGLGQLMKVINNAISGTTLAITSEALAVGCEHGMDLVTMLEVINRSSGRSVASDRKFPEQVVTGAYAHGGPGSHFQKDIGLFLQIADRSAVPHRLATESAQLWDEFARSWPGADQTEIFRYLGGQQHHHPDGDDG